MRMKPGISKKLFKDWGKDKMFRIKQCFLFIMMVIGLSSPTWAVGNGNTRVQPEIISLENCLDIALKNSPEIQASVQNVKIAREQVRQAEGGLWSTLGYEIAGSNSNENQIGWLYPVYQLDSKEVSTASISLTQPLYTGGRLTQGIEMAKLNLFRDSQLALDQALNGYYEGITAYLTAPAKLDLAIGKESL